MNETGADEVENVGDRCSPLEMEPALRALSYPALDVSESARRPKLLEPAELAEQGPPEAVRLPLDLIDPSPRNPRRDPREVDQLADSIQSFGLLQPVTV